MSKHHAEFNSLEATDGTETVSASLLLAANVQAQACQLSHLKLAGWQSRPELGQPLLCLHGWLDNANSFLPLAAALQKHSLFAVDLAGHGHSEHRSSDAHYYLFDYVSDIVELIQQRDWQQVTLVGHSMGGMIATALAAAMPELVSRLVLIDSFGFVTAAEHTAAQQLRKAIQSRQGRVAKQKPSYASLVHAAAARKAQSDFELPQALLLAERGTFYQPDVEKSVSWRADLRLREVSAQRLSIAQAKAIIADVSCPVLAVMAKDTIPLMEQNLSLYLQDYQNLSLHQLSGGHHLHMTNPQQVAEHLAAFINP